MYFKNYVKLSSQESLDQIKPETSRFCVTNEERWCDSDIQNLSLAIELPINNLTWISLRGCGINDSQITIFANALKHINNKVIMVDLSWNNITFQGAQILSEVVQHENNKLQELILACNQIGGKGVKAFSQAVLHHNCKLIRLEIYKNGPVFNDLYNQEIEREYLDMLIKVIPYSNLQFVGCLGSHADYIRENEAFKRQKIAKLCVVICSAYEVKRLSKQSSFKKFNVDLMRKINDFLR